MAIEIVDLPIHSMGGSFHSFWYVDQAGYTESTPPDVQIRGDAFRSQPGAGGHSPQRLRVGLRRGGAAAEEDLRSAGGEAQWICLDWSRGRTRGSGNLGIKGGSMYMLLELK